MPRLKQLLKLADDVKYVELTVQIAAETSAPVPPVRFFFD